MLLPKVFPHHIISTEFCQPLQILIPFISSLFPPSLDDIPGSLLWDRVGVLCKPLTPAQVWGSETNKQTKRMQGTILNSCWLFPLNPCGERRGRRFWRGEGAALGGSVPSQLPEIQGGTAGKKKKKLWQSHRFSTLCTKSTSKGTELEVGSFQVGNGSVFPFPGYPWSDSGAFPELWDRWELH